VPSFLSAVEMQTDPKKLSNGMWNKLYACIATVRGVERVNYWIYTDYVNDYDVSTREIVPHRITEDCAPIGEAKHDNGNSKSARNRRAGTHQAWRYDRQ
jgi:hypothetical protein